MVTDKESRGLPWALTHPPSCCPPAEWGKLDGEETETQLSSDGVSTSVPDLRPALQTCIPSVKAVSLPAYQQRAPTPPERDYE